VVVPVASPISVYEVMGTWSEATTNAANAPLLGDLLTTLEPPTAGEVFIETDLVDFIAGTGPISLYLVIDSADEEEGAELSARESGAGAPALILRWEP
jgi:hypothetical protein